MKATLSLAILAALCLAAQSPRQSAVQRQVPMRAMVTVTVTNQPAPMPGQTLPKATVTTFEAPAVQTALPSTNGNVTCFPVGYVFPKTGRIVTNAYCVTNIPVPPRTNFTVRFHSPGYLAWWNGDTNPATYCTIALGNWIQSTTNPADPNSWTNHFFVPALDQFVTVTFPIATNVRGKVFRLGRTIYVVTNNVPKPPAP